MSTLSIWRCEHDCDRRECYHCFTNNELDRLVEGHFKQYYAFQNSPRPDSKKRERNPPNQHNHNHNQDALDGSHFYDADTESHYHPHIKHHRGGCLPDVLHLFTDSVVDVDAIDAIHSNSECKSDSIQSVPGLLSSYQQYEPTTTDHALSNLAESEPKPKPKRIETAAHNNLHRNDTATHADAIDYESQCDIA